ncbi:MAG: GHKL domain-containing protein [Desulfobacteraceae bacterium]|nr:GHKL domain-containing protein [Desulfobacteraceae bacterium]
MNGSLTNSENDFYQKLKWLTFYRVIFTILLLGSTIMMQLTLASSPLDESLLVLYGLIIGIFILSFLYSLFLYRIKRVVFFTYIQISIDTLIVTLMIFLTGSSSSLFSFLYLFVIIYASMLLFRRGSMIMASLCSIQYGIMLNLEFYGILKYFGIERNLIIVDYTINYVLYKIMIMLLACFTVAFLSSLLSEQERKTKIRLWEMEDHVKHVEKMAAVGEMAAGLAHEIKNPLASLRSSIQILRGDIDYDPDRDKLMHIIIREADRLNSLVSDFLLFAKPPAGKKEIVDISDVLGETVELFEKNCRDRITITKEIASNIWAEIDSSHLRQIFWNLLLNASEAIEEQGVINIKLYPLRNKHAVVRIADNGCGISKETMRTIFNPFFTTKPNGTGLGLSIVHRIIESYGCWLDVESEVNRGTTFKLRLKRIDSPAVEEKKCSSDEKKYSPAIDVW